MTTYAWVGRTRNGQIVKGERAADSQSALTEALRREQILVTKISEAARKERRLRRISPRSLAIFTRQFSVMIDAGLPLVQCLELLAKEEPNKQLASAIEHTKNDVEGGASLADAMQKRPHAFDALYTNMVAAGEAGGILDTILKRLATFIEKQAKLVSQVRSAMIYPIAVLSIAVIVVMVILWKVIPTFTALFEGLNASLPLPTRVVIWASKQVIVAMPFMIVGGIIAGYAFRRYYGTESGRMRVDRMLLRMPSSGRSSARWRWRASAAPWRRS
jgi:type IV pilus assembly protein PilC